MSFKTVQRALVSAVVVAALSAGPVAAANIADETLPNYQQQVEEIRKSLESLAEQINGGNRVLQHADVFLRQIDSTGAVLGERDRRCAELEEQLKEVPPEAQWRFAPASQHCREGLQPLIRRFHYMAGKVEMIQKKVSEIKSLIPKLEDATKSDKQHLDAINGMTDLERSLAGYNDDLKNSRY